MSLQVGFRVQVLGMGLRASSLVMGVSGVGSTAGLGFGGQGSAFGTVGLRTS